MGSSTNRSHHHHHHLNGNHYGHSTGGLLLNNVKSTNKETTSSLGSAASPISAAAVDDCARTSSPQSLRSIIVWKLFVSNNWHISSTITNPLFVSGSCHLYIYFPLPLFLCLFWALLILFFDFKSQYSFSKLYGPLKPVPLFYKKDVEGFQFSFYPRFFLFILNFILFRKFWLIRFGFYKMQPPHNQYWNR